MRWRTYFLFRLAECQLEGSEGPKAALKTLDHLETEIGSLATGERALLALGRAVAHLHASGIDSADKQLTACASELEKALSCEGSSMGEDGMSLTDAELVQKMRAYYFLMYAVAAQAVGRGAQLQQGRFYD